MLFKDKVLALLGIVWGLVLKGSVCGMACSYPNFCIHSSYDLKWSALSLNKHNTEAGYSELNSSFSLIQLHHVPEHGQGKFISASQISYLCFTSSLVGKCSFFFLTRKQLFCHFVFWFFVCLWFSKITTSHETLTYSYNFLECFAIIGLCRIFLWIILKPFLEEIQLWKLSTLIHW